MFYVLLIYSGGETDCGCVSAVGLYTIAEVHTVGTCLSFNTEGIQPPPPHTHTHTQSYYDCRARKWNVHKAVEMLEKTLDWRREFGVQNLLQEEMDVVARENE